MEVRPLQLWKAVLPIVVTEFGMVTEVRPQPWKVSSKILVTELGMTIDFRL